MVVPYRKNWLTEDCVLARLTGSLFFVSWRRTDEDDFLLEVTDEVTDAVLLTDEVLVTVFSRTRPAPSRTTRVLVEISRPLEKLFTHWGGFIFLARSVDKCKVFQLIGQLLWDKIRGILTIIRSSMNNLISRFGLESILKLWTYSKMFEFKPSFPQRIRIY